MSWVERQVWRTWKCNHYAPDIPSESIDWCEAAEARGSACADPQPTSKASSRGYAARNDCPDCRHAKKNTPSDPKKDDDAGADGAGSAVTGQSTGITVGA
ncbi:hypothetical protein EMCG_00135 [[Emmonsia] crescens]|uniref:Uncharacterized protein n=1 Tax=[Emmonsia] crescens TaxID=73230 RepID=A0A0G2HTV6_9EURO|nr:hypothetical protein EMCG_00135 [Emmonsia crescens UAMH 3008]